MEEQIEGKSSSSITGGFTRKRKNTGENIEERGYICRETSAN